jgi:hypothetical protein
MLEVCSFFVEGSNDLCGEGSMRRIRPHLILPLEISLFLVDFLNKGLIWGLYGIY